MKLFFLVLGFVLFIEGLPYMVNPISTKEVMRLIIEQKNTSLRWTGFAIMVFGIVVMYMSKYLFAS